MAGMPVCFINTASFQRKLQQISAIGSADRVLKIISFAEAPLNAQIQQDERRLFHPSLFQKSKISISIFHQKITLSIKEVSLFLPSSFYIIVT